MFIFDAVFTLVNMAVLSLILAIIFAVTDMVIEWRYGSWAGYVYSRLKARVMDMREPDLIIYDRNEDPNGEDSQLPYLLRWYLLPRNRVFNIYLHRFIRSDHDVPHDHPWWSLSWMLKNFAFEHRPGHEVRAIKEGQWVWRTAKFAHRIEVPDHLIGGEGVTTLFITGPKIRRWGFHCPKGWRDWEAFVDSKYSGKKGAGCGELS